jgi:hypothetical protein
MMFAPEKSELLHFSRARAECTLLLRVRDSAIQPATEARFLGVWLNNRLSWKAYIAKFKAKMKTQMLAFSKLAASAWGTSMPKARQVYTVVIRSVLAYGAPNWHGIRKGPKGLGTAFTPTQNKGLRIVSGAYKATPARYFESEMAIPSPKSYSMKWPALENKLVKQFQAVREKNKIVTIHWFRRISQQIWQRFYPHVFELFVLSNGWFWRFLRRERSIVRHRITKVATKPPEEIVKVTNAFIQYIWKRFCREDAY